MQFIPFSPTLTRISAQTGRRLQSSGVDDAGRKRAKSSLPQPFTADGVAAYRWPSGMIAVAHDIYDPERPEGTEPGLARVHYQVQYHPNETASYKPSVLGFKSELELEREGLHVDRTAAGLLKVGSDVRLVVASDEADFADLALSFPERSSVLRKPITAVGDSGAPLDRFLAVSANTGGIWYASSVEIFGAPTDRELHEAAKARYPFLPAGRDLDEFCSELSRRGRQNGWSVCAGSREILMFELEPLLEIRTPTGDFSMSL